MRIIGQAQNWELIRDYLDEQVTDQLGVDVSNYAKGRKRVWMPFEAPLSNARPWAQGIMDERVWDYLQRISARAQFQCDVALLSRADEETGGISRHRDASYAAFRALGVNLGQVTFCSELCYPSYKWEAGTPTEGPITKVEMTGGEIFEFNCKNPHWVEDVGAGRWGINMWTVSGKEVRRFNKMKEA